MPLIKHRPQIRLLLPRLLFPGQRVSGTVVLHARHEVRVEGVAVELSGLERSVVGSGKSARRTTRTLLQLGARVARPGTISPGTTRYPFELALPAGLPPSFGGRRASVAYTLRVSAPIRWWPDAQAEFQVQVVQPPVVAPAPTPRLYASDPGGPRGREPYLECSLASDTLRPGGALQASVALHNVAFHSYRELHLTFRSIERAFTANRRRSSMEQLECYTARYPLQSPAEGAALPFALTLPEEVRPSAESVLWARSWFLEVRVEIPWSRDLVAVVPITVLPPGSRTTRAVAAPPAVGSERVQGLWRAVAEEQGLTFDGERLVGTVDGAELSLRSEHRGAKGLFLVGELRWPTLGLGLDGGRRSGFRRLGIGEEVSLAGRDPTWSRGCYLTGREAAQVRAFGEVLLGQEVLVPRPLPLSALTGLVDLHDEGLRAERRDPGQSHAALAAFAGDLRALAAALPIARAAIPAPALMAGAVDAWSALATELGGRLEQARMAVQGAALGVLRGEVVTEWGADGQPQRTRLTVTTATEIPAEHQLEWYAGGSEPIPRTGGLPTEAAVLLQEVAEGARSMVVRADVVEAALEAPLLHPAPAVPLLRKLALLAPLLGPRGGPYR